MTKKVLDEARATADYFVRGPMDKIIGLPLPGIWDPGEDVVVMIIRGKNIK